MPEPITRREARLRSAGVACLTGLAVAEVVELPYALAEGRHVAVLLAAVAVAAVRLAGLLARAGARRGLLAWRAAGALATIVVGGWIVSRAIPVPAVEEDAGHWTTMPGAAAATLAVAVAGLALAATGLPSLRRAVRSLCAATAVCAALTPGAAALFVALGPAPALHHGAGAGAAGGHAHAAAPTPPGALTFRPGFGGHAGRYVYANATPPHLPAWAMALVLGAAAVFVSAARGALARRVAAGPPEIAPSPGPRPGRTAAARALATLSCVVVIAAAAGGAPPSASAHATLVRATPAPLARVVAAPSSVVLVFSESVQVLRPADVTVVDHAGHRARAGRPITDRQGGRLLTLPLRDRLRADSYTVRYRVISADAHELDGTVVFAVGGAALRPPVAGPGARLSETGALAVDARFLELTGLGLLFALIVFRGLVWAPVLNRSDVLTPGEHALALDEERRRFWAAFWVVLGAAGMAEAAVLVVKAALAFGTGPWGALSHPSAIRTLMASSRFGELLGWRGGVLCALAAAGFWERLAEAADDRRARAGGRPAASLVLGVLSLAALALVSAQGHASQAAMPAVSIAFDALHLATAAVWVGGLAFLAVVLRSAPRVLGGAGRALGAATLRRFSRVAFVAMGLLGVTGFARAYGELATPAELWATPYGRTLLLKTALVAPVGWLAMRSRASIRAFGGGAAPTAGALRAVWRDVRLELGLATGIVLAAAVLVAELPGGP
jgi:copper transport protein